MDWEAEGLLEGLEGDAREARRRLLDHLHSDGVPVAQLRAAVEQERLVLLPLERALMGPETLTVREVAEESGFDLEQVAQRQRVVGVTSGDDPDAQVFTPEDLEAFRRARGYLAAGLPTDDLLAALRTVSSSVARAAEASRQVFAGAYLRAGDNEFDLAMRYEQMTKLLVPVLVADLEYLLRLHLREFARHDAVSLAEVTSGTLPAAVDVAVGFADFVGFTSLGEEIIGDVADRLLELADVHVHRPARVVKTIGDAVMLVSREPRPLAESLLDLVDAAEADGALPSLRAGFAFGPALPRAGDWYGGTVNLAARLCQRARPGAVLTTNAGQAALGDGYDFSPAGFKRLKGIAEPVPAQRVRRAPAASAP
ncbi:MAG TPA: adenylate cyclase regulatory domain-containing protein [Solirubrobacteraceae bacterium]|nr:adenylate cyclase regulatory domain-containing protein [Solirubrobacteraceae bacterium]